MTAKVELDLGDVVAMPSLRILHITEAPLGGVLTYLQELVAAQSVSAEVDQVHLLMPEINAEASRGMGSPKVDIRVFRHGRRSLAPLLALAREAARTIQEVGPDIVHIHSTVAGAIVRLSVLPMRARPTILYSPHGWFFVRSGRMSGGALSARIERYLSRLADGIVCVSEYEKQAAVAAGIPETKCAVIKTGIADLNPAARDELASRPRPAGPLKILYVGRFDHIKGFDVYLEVMRRLEGVAEGIAVGKFIVNRTERLTVPGNVRIVDWCPRDQLHRIYSTADLVLVPSRSEAFPMVPAEAMRMGVAVFGSRVGGLPELVGDRITGCLFEPGDVNEIVRLVHATPRPVLAEYGRRGREKFLKEFTLDRMNRDMMAHYRMMAGRRG